MLSVQGKQTVVTANFDLFMFCRQHGSIVKVQDVILFLHTLYAYLLKICYYRTTINSGPIIAKNTKNGQTS